MNKLKLRLIFYLIIVMLIMTILWLFHKNDIDLNYKYMNILVDSNIKKELLDNDVKFRYLQSNFRDWTYNKLTNTIYIDKSSEDKIYIHEYIHYIYNKKMNEDEKKRIQEIIKNKSNSNFEHLQTWFLYNNIFKNNIKEIHSKYNNYFDIYENEYVSYILWNSWTDLKRLINLNIKLNIIDIELEELYYMFYEN